MDFDGLLAELRAGWDPDGHFEDERIETLARLCGPAEIERLIDELDALEDAAEEGSFLDSPSPALRERHRHRFLLSCVLGAVGAPAADSLLAAMGRPNPWTGTYAAMALVGIPDARAYDPIVRLFHEDTDVARRVYLLAALGQLGDPRAIPLLMPRLKQANGDDRAPYLGACSEALGRLKAADVIPRLTELLQAEDNPAVRRSVVIGLREMSDKRAADAVARYGTADAEAGVRTQAEAGVEEYRRRVAGA